MPDLSDVVSEAVESAPDSDRLNSVIALLVAITATFMALSSVKSGNLGQQMSAEQSQTVDSWSYYQAKSMKQNLAEATLDQLVVYRGSLAPEVRAEVDNKIAAYTASVERYKKEKDEIRAQAEAHAKEYERLNVHDDQFDLSDAALSVSIALMGVTALTKKRWLLAFAIFFMLFGLFFGCAGFFQWDVHPEGLTSIFS